ncbi:MAG TPA: hypothetical protein VFA33_03125 [Bryobacteraceae bacterium]|nr:hypothetical protein [Bryobacteraceae bacterium]
MANIPALEALLVREGQSRTIAPMNVYGAMMYPKLTGADTGGRSLRQRLVKTGGRLVKHARYYWPMLAGRNLTRRFVQEHGPADRCAGGSDRIAGGRRY